MAAWIAGSGKSWGNDICRRGKGVEAGQGAVGKWCWGEEREITVMGAYITGLSWEEGI